jgi:hypothetical protein
MILTISSQDTDLCDAIAVALANRRADAGRNVLLLCQKMLSKAAAIRTERKLKSGCTSVANSNWLATEMKAGAKPRDVPVHQVADELVSSINQYRDIVIGLSSLDDADALPLLASSSLVLYVIQVATLDHTRQHDVIEQIKAVRQCLRSLPILIVIDAQYTFAGQALTAMLKSQIPQLQFIALSKIGALTITELYRIIYMECRLSPIV